MIDVDLHKAIMEAAYLDAEIKAKAERLRTLKQELANAVPEYKGQTGYIYTPDFTVKVQLKENITWDHHKLDIARLAMGNAEFLKTFSFEFKPRTKRDLDAFLKYHPEANRVLAAMNVKPGSPQVSFERINDAA